LFGLIGGLIIAVVVSGAVSPLFLQTPLAERLMEKEEQSLEVRMAPAQIGSLVRSINAPGEIATTPDSDGAH